MPQVVKVYAAGTRLNHSKPGFGLTYYHTIDCNLDHSPILPPWNKSSQILQGDVSGASLGY